MDNSRATNYVTTGDMARELGESPKRIAAIIYARQIKETGRIGNARVFDRDVVLPLISDVIERSRNRQNRRSHERSSGL